MKRLIGGKPTSQTFSQLFSDMLVLEADVEVSTELTRSCLDVSFYSDLALYMGLTINTLYDMLQISPEAARRLEGQQLLSVSESDHVFRQALLLRDALGLFEGNRQWAIDWLTRSNLALGNVTPASLLSSVASIARVRVLIWKVENGVCS